MNHDYRNLVCTITYQPQEPAYLVNFGDFPDIITSEDTLPQAFANACEALDLHLESLQKLARAVPQPQHQWVIQPAQSI